jgi:glutamate synthase domain-containing protein 2
MASLRRIAGRTAAALGVAAAGVAAWDVTQRRHAILRTFPLVGHLRFALEAIGPELRQYIVTDNDEERPFSRDQRRWIYTSAKGESNLFGFGTDNHVDTAEGYLVVTPSVLPGPGIEAGADPHAVGDDLPSGKVLGGARGRREAFRPDSVVNLSAMSFGSLSGPAIEALNRGAVGAGCLHNTGEGGISRHHLHGGDLIWQIGTGYFGCRDADGGFDFERLVDVAAQHPVRAIELKLSQGAKPGLGGMLPAAKVSAEIAEVRGVPEGQDCFSPAYHTAFDGVDGLLELVEEIAQRTGLPVGIKSAVGELGFWDQLADRMAATGRGVDHITIDGGEGGTGAAPRVWADHVALPFMVGFSRVYRALAERQLAEDVVWIGAGRLGLPDRALEAMGLGVDLVNVGREAMLALGCIQTQRCHTDRCPTGVATQNAWLARGVDPDDKSARVEGYVRARRTELRRLARTCGSVHPTLVPLDRFELVDAQRSSRTAREVFGYESGWGLPGEADVAWLRDWGWGRAASEVTVSVGPA